MAGIVGLTELQHTNGTSAATIDTSGRLGHSVHSSFIAHTPNNGSVNAILVFTQTIENIGSNYDTSTGLYTAPIKGLYTFSFSK